MNTLGLKKKNPGGFTKGANFSEIVLNFPI